MINAASELALAYDILDLETRTRTLMTFFQQWNDPRAGLDAARLGQARARRIGSRLYDLLMVGNGVSCAIRVGEWDWAIALLDEWLPTDMQPAYRLEMTVDRAILTALRGEDPAPLIAELEPMLVGVTDPQFGSYRRMASAWVALVAGRFGEAIADSRAAASQTTYFGPLGLPLAARAAIWSRDPVSAQEALGALSVAANHGAALDTDRVAIRAGLAALDGRPDEALGLYREALASWRSLGLAWDEALTAIDMVMLLGARSDRGARGRGISASHPGAPRCPPVPRAPR